MTPLLLLLLAAPPSGGGWSYGGFSDDPMPPPAPVARPSPASAPSPAPTVAPAPAPGLIPTIDGAALGRRYAPGVLSAFADGWEAAAAALAAGQGVPECQQILWGARARSLQQSFAPIAPQLAVVLPEGTEPRDAAHRARVVRAWRDFARGLRGTSTSTSETRPSPTPPAPGANLEPHYRLMARPGPTEAANPWRLPDALRDRERLPTAVPTPRGACYGGSVAK